MNKVVSILLILTIFSCSQASLSKNYTLNERISQYGFGFSIDYREEWSAQELLGTSEDHVKLLTKQNAYVLQFIRLSDSKNEAGVTVGANYIKGDEGYTLEEMKKNLENNSFPNEIVIEQKIINLNGHDALYRHVSGPKYTYSCRGCPAEGDIAVPQNIAIYLIEKGRVFTLVYGSTRNSPDNFEEHKSIALAIMKSFRFTS